MGAVDAASAGGTARVAVGSGVVAGNADRISGDSTGSAAAASSAAERLGDGELAFFFFFFAVGDGVGDFLPLDFAFDDFDGVGVARGVFVGAGVLEDFFFFFVFDFGVAVGVAVAAARDFRPALVSSSLCCARSASEPSNAVQAIATARRDRNAATSAQRNSGGFAINGEPEPASRRLLEGFGQRGPTALAFPPQDRVQFTTEEQEQTGQIHPGEQDDD